MLHHESSYNPKIPRPETMTKRLGVRETNTFKSRFKEIAACLKYSANKRDGPSNGAISEPDIVDKPRSVKFCRKPLAASILNVIEAHFFFKHTTLKLCAVNLAPVNSTFLWKMHPLKSALPGKMNRVKSTGTSNLVPEKSLRSSALTRSDLESGMMLWISTTELAHSFQAAIPDAKRRRVSLFRARLNSSCHVTSRSPRDLG
jgi:hypothetical protein